jgi:hypothetical protein
MIGAMHASPETFREQFKQAMTQLVLLGCKPEHHFGELWIELETEFPLEEGELRDLYSELLDWTRTLRDSEPKA